MAVKDTEKALRKVKKGATWTRKTMAGLIGSKLGAYQNYNSTLTTV